jgi:hypothetical protein
MTDYIDLPTRPFERKGRIFDYNTGCGSVFITVTLNDDGTPYEVFLTKGASGGCTQAYAEAVGKLISISLRCNVDPAQIIKMLTGISCNSVGWMKGFSVKSCPSAIAMALTQVMNDLKKPNMVKNDSVEPEKELTEDEVKAQMEELKNNRPE